VLSVKTPTANNTWGMTSHKRLSWKLPVVSFMYFQAKDAVLTSRTKTPPRLLILRNEIQPSTTYI
jgi:hypothetical protein